MSKIEKLIEKFLTIPKDLEWNELIKILSFLGFELQSTGISGGSRRVFKNKDGVKLYFHEPHPGKIVKVYQIKQTIEELMKAGIL